MSQPHPIVPSTAAEIAQLLSRCRLDFSTEKRLQAGIEEILIRTGYQFEREKRLSDADIPDFLIAGSIIIECKVRGARKMDTWKQLNRYALHGCVKAIILASNISMGLPPEIEGKPVYAASMSAGWL